MATRATIRPPDVLGCDLGWTLGMVFREYVGRADAVLEDVPGGPRGYQVLVAAADDDTPSGQGALARRLGVDKTVMTYLVDDLESAGLVRREPDPADRRHRILVATAKGRRAARSRQQRLRTVEDDVLHPLSARERAELRDLLNRLAHHAAAGHGVDGADDLCATAEAVSRGPRAGSPRGRRR